MTYDSRERSADQARPVELYEFRREALIWRYTTADRDYVQDFQTFQRAAIRRDVEGRHVEGRQAVRADQARRGRQPEVADRQEGHRIDPCHRQAPGYPHGSSG